MSESYTFGQVAEQKAVNYIKEMIYIVLEQNYRYRKAGIDIIAKRIILLFASKLKHDLLLILECQNLF